MIGTKIFWGKIIKWYVSNGREYPWRKTNNAFHILIAEFLLQQTHVRKVEEIYNRFISEFPEPHYLANAELNTIKMMIKPLGLKYRAERLINCAKILSEKYDGNVPSDKNKLLELPGVGPYISDAVLCYAYNFPTIPIDTNVIRVFCRYFNLTSNKRRPRTDSQLLQKIKDKYLEFESTRTANLSILDFSGIICKSISPECLLCPVSNTCINRQLG